jgi:hypothetical protein
LSQGNEGSDISFSIFYEENLGNERLEIVLIDQLIEKANNSNLDEFVDYSREKIDLGDTNNQRVFENSFKNYSRVKKREPESIAKIGGLNRLRISYTLDNGKKITIVEDFLCSSNECKLFKGKRNQFVERTYKLFLDYIKDNAEFLEKNEVKIGEFKDIDFYYSSQKDLDETIISKFSESYEKHFEKIMMLNEAGTKEEYSILLEREFGFEPLSKQDRFLRVYWEEGQANSALSDMILYMDMIRNIGEVPKVIDWFSSSNFTFFVLENGKNLYILPTDLDVNNIVNARTDFNYRHLVSPEILNILSSHIK